MLTEEAKAIAEGHAARAETRNLAIRPNPKKRRRR